jgi:23S rRNA (cytidine1920-2'-O)/16S rRNA (cytidine1409-2'-O)-methyltransferase
MERMNSCTLTPSYLPGLVYIVTIDVSFISLRHIFPKVPALLRPSADVVALVKPQFEAGRSEVGKKGVVRDPAIHERVVQEATKWAAEVGLGRVAMTESPITGDIGNREFFLHLRGTTVSRPAMNSGRPEHVEGRDKS